MMRIEPTTSKKCVSVSDSLNPGKSFFRDLAALEVLAENVIPLLFAGKGNADSIRVWVPGCATGDDAYTIAILLLEESARHTVHPEIQIFASDRNPEAVAVGREGRYPASIETDLSIQRLETFFLRRADHYRVRKELRDRLLFASHDVFQDPPFSRLNLISCRNLLGQLDRKLQARAFDTFHYALEPDGFLFLGAAESVGNSPGRFIPVNRGSRIYRSVAASRQQNALPQVIRGSLPSPPSEQPYPHTFFSEGREGVVAMHQPVFERLDAPILLVGESLRPLHLSSNAGRYVQLPGGLNDTDATEMVRAELRLDLRRALQRAFELGKATLSAPVTVMIDGASHRVCLHVKPALQHTDETRHAVVFFIEDEESKEHAAEGGRDRSEPASVDLVAQLREELQRAHRSLQDLRNRFEAATAELSIAKEEMQSITEEYRSTNEELETSREELQSTNEELQTVNSELNIKLETLARAHSDLENLMAATDVGTLFLDRFLRIKRFTPSLTALFSISSQDEGRPITDFNHRLHYSEFLAHVRAVSSSLVPTEHEVQSRDVRWYLVRIRPYRATNDYIDGVVITFVDITERKHAEQARQQSDERLQQFGEASQDVLWIRDAAALQWQYLTPAFEAIYGLPREEALSGNNYRSWLELIVPEDRPRAMSNIERVRAGEFVTFEYRIQRPRDGAIRWLRNTDFPIADESGRVLFIGGIGHDMTEMRATELRFEMLVEGIPQLLWRADERGDWTWASPQWTRFTGQSEPESRGSGWLELLHPSDRAAAREAWSRAGAREGFEVEYRILSRGERGYRWFQTRAAPVRDEVGTIVEWLGTSTDIHELRELQDRQKVLVGELQHRTRNLVSVIQAMFRSTLDSSADLTDFRARFGDRLEALARVQSLLSRLTEGERVAFDQLIHSELAAVNGTLDRVTLNGPEGIRLRSSTVQTLAMAVHELATNAVKYGALGQPQAHLAVFWSMEPADDKRGRPRLHIDWRETDVSMPRDDGAPQGKGHGRELIEKALPYQLDAETHFELGNQGVRCTISIPVSTSNLETELRDD
jgi:two-component system, chemotaxis family, CheB/CheR fusion protein